MTINELENQILGTLCKDFKHIELITLNKMKFKQKEAQYIYKLINHLKDDFTSLSETMIKLETKDTKILAYFNEISTFDLKPEDLLYSIKKKANYDRFKTIEELEDKITKSTDLSEITKLVEEVKQLKEKNMSNSYDIVSIDEVMTKDFEFGEKDKSIPSFLKDITTWSKGYHRSEPSCISGSSGTGKTAFMMTEAINMVAVHNLRVLILSQEMKRKAITQRALSTISGYSSSYWNPAMWNTEEQFNKLVHEGKETLENVLNKNLHITHKRLKLSELLNLIKEKKNEYDVIFFDYFGLLENDISPSNVVGYDRDAQTSKMIKDALLDTEIAFIWLSQITNDESAKKDPRKAAIRGSKQLEHDCATMILLYRKLEEENDDLPQLHVFITKARHGEKFKEQVVAFNGDKQQIGNFKIDTGKKEELDPEWSPFENWEENYE